MDAKHYLNDTNDIPPIPYIMCSILQEEYIRLGGRQESVVYTSLQTRPYGCQELLYYDANGIIVSNSSNVIKQFSGGSRIERAPISHSPPSMYVNESSSCRLYEWCSQKPLSNTRQSTYSCEAYTKHKPSVWDLLLIKYFPPYEYIPAYYNTIWHSISLLDFEEQNFPLLVKLKP